MFVNFTPEPGPKSLARLTTLKYTTILGKPVLKLTVSLYDLEIHEQLNCLPNFDTFFDFHPILDSQHSLYTYIRSKEISSRRPNLYTREELSHYLHRFLSYSMFAVIFGL